MSRTILTALLVLPWLGTFARAQFNFVGPGSTVEGDYLRGVGVASFGMGVYNHQTAVANSINADTAMRVNEYVYACLMNENRMNAEHRAKMAQKNKEDYEKLQKRIRENPEALDVDKGDALNSILERLNDPRISDSFSRSVAVPLSVDEVRRIPFKLGEKGVKSFSMQRLTAKGKSKWPVAFQDDRFDRDRQAFERALDNALEQQIQGKMQKAAIEAVDEAVENLYGRLIRVFGESTDTRYLEGKNRLGELKAVVEMLKFHQIEMALGELDQYSGTTVDDLRVFMHKHKLQFARAGNPEELKLYPELFTKLKMQHDKVTVGIGVQDDEPKK
jgi:hypothetical protein